MNEEDYVEIDDAIGIRNTSRAVLVQLSDREIWVPQSIIHDNSEIYGAGTVGTLIIARWWAEKNNLG